MTVILPTRIELIHISSTICIGTFIVNSLIAMFRSWLRQQPKVVPDMHWERRISGENLAPIFISSDAVAEKARVQPSTNFDLKRGFLTAILAPREPYVDSKRDMRWNLAGVLRDLRYTFDNVTYLGMSSVCDETGRPDVCLYARHRRNGITSCQGEIASLHICKSSRYLQVRLSRADSILVKEAGWALEAPKTWQERVRNLCSFSDDTCTCLMPLPRNCDELDTVIKPVIEAAISATTIQQYV